MWLTKAEKAQLFEVLDYTPNEAQWPIHDYDGRLPVIYGGERAGKSSVAAKKVTEGILGLAKMRALHPKNSRWRKPRIAVAARKYAQTKEEMGYIRDDLVQLGLWKRGVEPRQNPWVYETHTNAEIRTISLADGTGELTGTGQAFHIVLVCEAGLVVQEVLGRAIGRTAETRGQVILSGTLWDSFGWYADLYHTLGGPNMYGGERFILPSWSNTAIYPGGESDPEILRLKATLAPDEFSRLVAAELVASPARVFPEASQATHFRYLDYDPNLPVIAAIDPGYFPSRYSVLAGQVATDSLGRELLLVIRELWVHHHTHHDAVAAVKEWDCWENVEIIYGGHETRQHMASMSAEEVWTQQTGLPFRVTSRSYNYADAIMRVRTLLRDPMDGSARVLFDSSCEGLAHEFYAFKRPINKEGVVTSDKPIKKNCDALDALRHLVVGKFGMVERPNRPGKPGQPWQTSIG